MNTTEHHDPTLRHAFISLTKFVDTLVNEKVLNENDELRLIFLKWRTNNNFNNRWTIEHPNYQVKRDDEIFDIDKEVKKVFPTVKFIDLPMNKTLNPSLIKIILPMIKVYIKKQPLRGNVGYYYKCELLQP